MRNQFSGRPFKVVSEVGTLLAEFDDFDSAQTYADEAHYADPVTHFQVVKIEWCGGSKRFSDRDKE